MLHHIFISVNNVDKSISFYEQAWATLGIRHVVECAYAANIFDPDGCSIEVEYKSWQHPQPRSQVLPSSFSPNPNP